MFTEELKSQLLAEINKTVDSIYDDFSKLIKKYNLELSPIPKTNDFRMDFPLKEGSLMYLTPDTQNIKNDIEAFFKDKGIDISSVSISSIVVDKASFIFSIQDNSSKEVIDDEAINNMLNSTVIKTLYGKYFMEKHDNEDANVLVGMLHDPKTLDILRNTTNMPMEIKESLIKGVDNIGTISKSILLHSVTEGHNTKAVAEDKNSLDGVLSQLAKEHKDSLNNSSTVNINDAPIEENRTLKKQR